MRGAFASVAAVTTGSSKSPGLTVRNEERYLKSVPIHQIEERWIGKFERQRLRALHELKKGLEGDGKRQAEVRV